MKKIFLLVSLLVLAACSQSQSVDQSQNDQAEITSPEKVIVTSFYPLEYLAKSIAGDKFEVLNITQGKDPHSYNLTPKDIQVLQDADLFVFQGAGLESWAEDIAVSRVLPSFEVAESIELNPTEDHDNHEDDNEEEHNHTHEEESDEHENEHEHEHGEFDPHSWLDPILFSETAQKLASEVTNLDPENSSYYQENLNLLTLELSNLDNQYQDSLSVCQNKEAISSHDAFSYLEARYNFELHPISGLSPQNEPSSKQLQELIDIANTDGITHILEEEFNNQSFAQTIQSETGLQVLTVNTLESSPTAEKDYIQIMQDNLQSFQQAFQCN